MIDSKFKIFGIFGLMLSVFLFIGICFFIYVLVSVVFLGGHIIPRGTLPSFGAVIFIFLFIILLIAIASSLTRYPFAIKIDQNKKTIFFKNVITQQKKLYNFNDFDYYLDTLAYNSKTGESYKVIYLIQNKKAEKIITGFYYSNIDELQEALCPIKYFGFQTKYSILARKAFWNKSIID